MVRSILSISFVLLIVVAAWAEEQETRAAGERRPTRIWNRTGPLGDTPQRLNDDYPLSDQSNQGGWTRFEPMWDEFEGEQLDPEKWNVGLYWWKGRQPALFSPQNVSVSDGQLHLTMRKEKVPEEFENRGSQDYTSAALHSRIRSGYGYYEVKAKPMNSAGSSSFWFQVEDTPGWLTEIDVFEIGGKAPGFEQKYNMNLHVFRTPEAQEHWSAGGEWVAPWRLADDYHVYGLQWSPEEVRYFVDGVLVRSVENTHWHQPLFMIFDSETMPDWFGMPEDADLPSTYSVEYVRAWKREDKAAWQPLFNGENLDGWVVKCRPGDQDKASYWQVVDGTITAETPPGSPHHYIWLLTEKEYGDFALRLKVQTYGETTGNSGVQVRSRYDESAGWLDGPQVDINPPTPWRNGFIYDETRGAQVWLWTDVGPPANAKPEHAPAGWKWSHAGEQDVWNDVEIVCHGMRISTAVNGGAASQS
jgi:beta-glucanase (GH16 family)